MTKRNEPKDKTFYICSAEGILKGPYYEAEANRIIDDIPWEEKLKFKYLDDGTHPYEKIMDKVQSKCNEIQVFRKANSNLTYQMQNFLDSRYGLRVGYILAYVDYPQPVEYCSPDEVLSISGIDTGKRYPIIRTNFGCPQIVNFADTAL